MSVVGPDKVEPIRNHKAAACEHFHSSDLTRVTEGREGLCIHCRDAGGRVRSAVLDLEVGDARRGGRCCPRQLHTGVGADVRSGSMADGPPKHIWVDRKRSTLKVLNMSGRGSATPKRRCSR